MTREEEIRSVGAATQRAEKRLVKCPPEEEKAAFSLTHSLISSLYLIALYLDSTVRWPILDARGSAMKQQLLVALTVNGADSGKQQSTPGIT